MSRHCKVSFAYYVKDNMHVKQRGKKIIYKHAISNKLIFMSEFVYIIPPPPSPSILLRYTNIEFIFLDAKKIGLFEIAYLYIIR